MIIIVEVKKKSDDCHVATAKSEVGKWLVQAHGSAPERAVDRAMKLAIQDIPTERWQDDFVTTKPPAKLIKQDDIVGGDVVALFSL